MRNNAIKFNGIGSLLGNEANAIYDFVKGLIDENRKDLTAMEEAVQDQLNGRKKKPKKQKEETSRPKADPAQNVVLDGVEVNIGDVDFGLGGDSDSD